MRLKKLFWNWNNTIKAFPFSHFLLIITSILLIWRIEGTLDLNWINKLLIALWITFIISIYWPLFSIHSQRKDKIKISQILQLWSIIIWWIYYFIILNVNGFFNLNYSESLLYFWIIPLSILLIPLIISFIHRKESQKIWFSWTSLFISVIFWAIAWSIILWWISWALASIESLFDVYIEFKWYEYIAVLSGILLTWSFILNYYLKLTENISEKKSEFKIESSRIRKIFWTFIFLPLSIIYLVIFGAYWIKILFTWIWPRWTIVWLWIGYFALWIITLYSIYPEKKKLYEAISNILYISFILITFMMIWAIYQRISQYGITINRWFVCWVIAIIISYSALSLIFPKRRFLSFISVWFIISFISLYWPLSANNISYKSQVNRLTTLLLQQNISLPLWEWSLENLTWDSASLTIWIIEELVTTYNKEKIINRIISFDYSDYNRYYAVWQIKEFLKIRDGYKSYNQYYNFWQNNMDNHWIDVSWYSKIYKFDKYLYENNDTEWYKLTLNIENNIYNIDYSDYIDSLIEKAMIEKYSNPTEEEIEILNNPALIIEQDNYKLIITWFSAEKDTNSDKIKFNNLWWYILIK